MKKTPPPCEQNPSEENSSLLCNSSTHILLPEEVSEFGRRQFLSAGVALTATISLAKLLAPLSAHAAETYTVKRKLVWINMGGGWDILEVTDPKPASTARIDMTYPWEAAHALAGGDTNTRVGRWMPGLAENGRDTLLLRGLAMGTTSHDAGSTYMDTSILSNNGRVNAASIPSIVSSESSATIPIIQLAGGMDPRIDRGLLKNISVVRAQNLDLYRSMYPTEPDLVARRLKLLDYMKGSIDRLKTSVGTNDRLTAVDTANSKIKGQIESGIGAKLSLTNDDKAAFAQASASAGARGMGRGGDAFALALKLIKNDLVTCVNMGVGGFDTHSNQDRNLMPILTEFDRNLKVFVNELRNAGKLNDTLIVLYSDFGRTPKVNGSAGRDHWPVGSAVLIGGGLDGGRAVGATDDALLSKNVDPSTGLISDTGIQLNPTHLGGSVLELTLGADYLTRRPYLSSLPALTRTR